MDNPPPTDNNALNYKELFDKMLNGFAYHQIVTDSTGKPIDYVFLEVNRAFEEVTGLKRSEILGKKVTEVLPGTEKENARWIERYSKVASTGIEERFEAYSVGVQKWFKVYAFSPKKNYFAVIIEDISKIKNDEISNSYYKLLLDRTGDLIDILSIELSPKYLYTNKAHKEILGYNPEDLLGKETLSLIHPDDKYILINALLKHFKKVGKKLLQKRTIIKPVAITLRIRRNDGEYVVVQSTADIIEGKIFVVSRDVTSQSNYVQQIKKEKEKTESYLDIVANIVLALDTNWTITTINKSGCAILEDTQENIIGKNWLEEFVTPEERQSVQRLMKKIQENDSSSTYFENNIQTKSGSKRLIRWHNKLILDDETNEIIGTLSSGEDITEIREKEIVAKKSMENLERFNKLTTGRELKMVELKKRIRDLEEELKNK